MLDRYRFISIMAYQRSGTNMLGWAIHSHPDVHYTSEIFHRNLAMSEEKMTATIEKALVGVDAEVICLDTKYNQITPPLEVFLRTIPVIHLMRLDDRRHWFSFELRRFWNKHPEMRNRREWPKSLPFREQAFNSFVERKRGYLRQFSYLQHLRLSYEELTGNGPVQAVPEQFGRVICEIAGVGYAPLTTHTLKSAPVEIESYWR